MAKRFVCCLLALCLLGHIVPEVGLAAEAEGPIDVTLSLYSNISHDTYISGLYDDDVFYITLEKLCELVDGAVTSRSNNQATIKVGIREFDLDVGSGNMAEKLYSENYNITMPSILKDGQIYISALHFLRYIGATVHIDEQANIQFMVIKRYDIFNAIEDLSASESGNFFWWDEIDAEYGEIEDMIVNAGVIALINRDSNIFRMMFDAKGMEREAVEDALLSIVKNEGAGYFDENSKESELIDTASGLIGAESDWFGLIKEAFQDTSELGDQISDLADSAALTAGFANNVVKAVESLKQFDNMSIVQKDLLATTILAHSNDSKTLNNQWGVVLDAARNVDAKVQNEYAAQIGAATQVAQSTAYDLMNGVTGAAGANPVSIAWNGAILLTKLIPSTNQMIGRKDKLYNAYNSSMIQLIANEMLADAYSDWYYSNGMYTNIGTQYDMLNTVKQLIIFQLKSTLTTREYLIQSGFLDENYADSMKELNQDIALLLNKTENCKITGVNMYSAEYEEDLSWIANLEHSSDFEYELRTETIEFRTSDGILYYSNTVEYPYFFGTTQAELKINRRYERIIADFRNNEMDVDAAYQESLEWGVGMFPFFDDIKADVVYNKNGAVSVKEVSTMWSGGAHPYHEDYGITFDKETGEELTYYDILIGSTEQVDKVLRNALSSTLGQAINEHMLLSLKEYTGYSLCDSGLCFYYNVGYAIPRKEVVIPFTDENSYVINAEKIYIEIPQVAMSTKPALDVYLGTDINDFAATFNTFIDMNECSSDGIFAKASFETDRITRLIMFNGGYSLKGIDLDMTFLEAVAIAEATCDYFIEDSYLRSNQHYKDYMMPDNTRLSISTIDETTIQSVAVLTKDYYQ